MEPVKDLVRIPSQQSVFCKEDVPCVTPHFCLVQLPLGMYQAKTCVSMCACVHSNDNPSIAKSHGEMLKVYDTATAGDNFAANQMRVGQ